MVICEQLKDAPTGCGRGKPAGIVPAVRERSPSAYRPPERSLTPRKHSKRRDVFDLLSDICGAGLTAIAAAEARA